ncbi:MAG: class I SAM-dependent methyltransferase [Actinomycetota bacterium]
MSAAGGLYDQIGRGYAGQRREDPRIAAQLLDALGEWRTLVNVGAGTGNYEPVGRRVVAVEPSVEMIGQRSGREALAVRASAEALPFRDGAFDVALAMFTIHHWSDRTAGLHELARVASRHVSLVYDPAVTDRLWLHDFFPEIRFQSAEAEVPTAEVLGQVLDVVDVRPLMVPFDCSDGFTGAFFGRPEAYLEPAIQAGMSTLTRLPEAVRAAGTRRLRDALADGTWDGRYGDLRRTPEYDIGYRLALTRARK